MQYWLKLGVPETKLVLGIGLYGRCFTLARADQHDVYSPSYQPGLPGPYTRSPGMQGFNEVRLDICIPVVLRIVTVCAASGWESTLRKCGVHESEA